MMQRIGGLAVFHTLLVFIDQTLFVFLARRSQLAHPCIALLARQIARQALQEGALIGHDS